jgi:PAS domain S-box-containing protein
MPAVKAALGQEGIVEGDDYRGVRVIADVRGVPDSPWFLVARMDVTEVNAPLRERLWMIIGLVATLLFGAGAGVGLIWRQQRLRFFRTRLAAAEALETSENKFRNLFNNALEGVYQTTPKGRLITANMAFARMFGYESPGEAVKTLTDIARQMYVDPDERKTAVNILRETGFLKDFEVQMRKKDGSVIWVSINARLNNSPDGNPKFEGFITDITQRKRAEEVLRQSHERFQLANRATYDTVWDWDLRTNALWWNENFQTLFGYGVEEIEPGIESWTNRIHPEDLERVRTDIHEAIDSGRHSWSDQYRFRRKDGRYAVVDDRGYIARQADGSPVRMIGAMQDITERKRAEEALIIQKRMGDIFLMMPGDEMYYEVLKIILEVMESPFGVFGYIDEAGSLVVPSMTRHIWDKCQVLQKTITFPRETWGDSSWPRAIREKKPNYSNVISTKTPEGHVSLKRHISLPILYQGEVIGLFQVANKEVDYTEADIRVLEMIAEYVAPVLSVRLHRLRHEEELRKKNEELRSKNDELIRFNYAVSHDLKSPLVTIQTFVGYLEQDVRKPDAAGVDKDLEYIRTASDKMSRLLNELLELSRIGLRMNPPVEAPLQAIVKEALDLVAGRIAERGVKVKVTKKPILLYGDRPRLVEIFQNLVDNAVKFMGDQPVPLVEIGAEQADDEIVLFVHDNGMGIDKRHQSKLFGLFEKLDPGSGGTGIGLALVKRIVEVHGGKIRMESEGPGQGATFRFTLAKTRRL